MFGEKMKLNSNSVIRKSKELASTPIKLVELNKGLDLRQQRFFNMAILSVNEKGISEFGKEQYNAIFKDDKDDNFYSENTRETVEKLGSLGMREETEKSVSWKSLFNEVKYLKEEGIYRFNWSPLVIEHVLNVKKNYIQQDLQVLAHFKNKYSFIWYDYFKSEHLKWKWKLSKEEVYDLLGIKEDATYRKKHTIFLQHCVEKPLEELKEHTEYNVSVKIVRQGERKIVGYEFTRRTDKTVDFSVSDKQINTLQEIVDRYMDINAIQQELLKFISVDVDIYTRLASLLFELHSYKMHLINAESYTKDAFVLIVKQAIDKDNEFKAKFKELLDKRRATPTIDDFIEEQGDRPKYEFYNWLEERE